MSFRTGVTLLACCLGFPCYAAGACGSGAVAGSPQQLADARCNAEHQNWPAAKAEIDAFRNFHSESSDAELILAQILIGTGHHDSAAAMLQSLLSIHPRNIPGLILYGELAQRLSQPELAEDLLGRATRYAPDNAECWKRLGSFYLAKRPAEAATPFEVALKLSPDDPLALAGLAAAHDETGRSNDAGREYTRAADLNLNSQSPDPMIEYLYARHLAGKEKYEDSLSHYGRALTLDQGFDDARFARAEALVELKRWSAATADLEETSNSPSHELPSLVLLVKVYKASGELNKAEELSRRLAVVSEQRDAERAKGNAIAGQMQNASSQFEAREFQRAADLYSRIITEHPEASHAYLSLGKCYVALGRAKDAESALRNFLQLEPDSADGHVILGKALLLQRNYVGARTEFRLSMELDPLKVDARLGLAASSIQQGSYQDAIETLDKTIRIAPDSIDARLMMAEALSKSHNDAQAVSALDLVLKLDPANETAGRMREALVADRKDGVSNSNSANDKSPPAH